MKQSFTRIAWGVILIVAGVLFGLHQLNMLPFNLLFDGWWSLFIIVPSAMALLTEQDKWGGLIGLLFGVFFLLSAQDVLDMSLLWKLILPAAVVLCGLRLLFGRRQKKQQKISDDVSHCVSGDASHCVAVFSGQELHCDNKPFHGAQVVAVFGGVDVFASSAIVTEDCVLEIAAVFGGVDVYLPVGVNVEVTSGGIFGGVENQRRIPAVEGVPTVYVKASAVFGGVDIH